MQDNDGIEEDVGQAAQMAQFSDMQLAENFISDNSGLTLESSDDDKEYSPDRFPGSGSYGPERSPG